MAALVTPVTPQESRAPADKKNLWTSEDLEALQDRAPVSVVGKLPETASAKPASPESATRDESAPDAAWYRERLRALRAESARIGPRIKELRRFQSASYALTGYWPLRDAGMPLNPADEIRRLEQHRRELRDRIAELEDEARRKGIAPGDLS